MTGIFFSYFAWRIAVSTIYPDTQNISTIGFNFLETNKRKMSDEVFSFPFFHWLSCSQLIQDLGLFSPSTLVNHPLPNTFLPQFMLRLKLWKQTVIEISNDQVFMYVRVKVATDELLILEVRSW